MAPTQITVHPINTTFTPTRTPPTSASSTPLSLKRKPLPTTHLTAAAPLQLPYSPVSPPDSPQEASAPPRHSIAISTYEEIRLESPRVLQPLGLGIMDPNRPPQNTEVFEANFNRWNRRDGADAENGLFRSNSNGSNRSSVGSSFGGYMEKPPAYVPPLGEKVTEENWYKPPTWSPLMWIQMLLMLGLPTLTLSWGLSLIYFSLLPRLSRKRGKEMEDWILESIERNAKVRGDGKVEFVADVKEVMMRWEIGTAVGAMVCWTMFAVVGGVLAVDSTRTHAGHLMGGAGNGVVTL
ncbi:hypothetical protein BDZ91DRAFT_796187 [Kalaharituber pfeilii]|nr:hypothetical protein BDZ91DRAFT_796187 [Kalaharituber pfeilii]